MRVGQSRKRDANEASIVQALRAVGATVIPVSGEGAPDLLVYYRRQWLPVEVKSAKGTLTVAQVALRLRAPFAVVRSVEDALKLFGTERQTSA